MLDRSQYLLTKLTKLTEECAEVQQRALKQMQFGRDQSQASDAMTISGKIPEHYTEEERMTNAVRLRGEINDLLAIILKLELNGDIPRVSGDELVGIFAKKFEKLEKYKVYSRYLGFVE